MPPRRWGATPQPPSAHGAQQPAAAAQRTQHCSIAPIDVLISEFESVTWPSAANSQIGTAQVVVNFGSEECNEANGATEIWP